MPRGAHARPPDRRLQQGHEARRGRRCRRRGERGVDICRLGSVASIRFGVRARAAVFRARRRPSSPRTCDGRTIVTGRDRVQHELLRRPALRRSSRHRLARRRPRSRARRTARRFRARTQRRSAGHASPAACESAQASGVEPLRYSDDDVVGADPERTQLGDARHPIVLRVLGVARHDRDDLAGAGAERRSAFGGIERSEPPDVPHRRRRAARRASRSGDRVRSRSRARRQPRRPHPRTVASSALSSPELRGSSEIEIAVAHGLRSASATCP